ncbi:MAG: fibronectin type III domain-containing protein [Candidatus Diapherotrites archaeon]|nr:fibronectin type III domain-containing protein [Candidatus Diapherotrites archaeon]
MLLFRKTLVFLALLLFLPCFFALDAPTVHSVSHPQGTWTNNKEKIDLTWNAVEGASDYCYALDASPTVNPNTCISGTKISLPAGPEGIFYFRIKARGAGGESAVAQYEIKKDWTDPGTPEITAIAQPDGSISLSWPAVEDAGSGVDGYEIYRSGWMNFTIRDPGAIKLATISGTTYTDSNGLEQSVTYHYKVRAVDKAGNPGSTSREAVAQTVAKCDLGISFDVAYSSDKKSLLLSISSLDNIYHGGLSALLPDGTTKVFFSEKEPFKNWDSNFDLSGLRQGYIDFTLLAKELFGDNCDEQQRFVYDITPPTAKFVAPKYNEKVAETAPLQVDAFDTGEFDAGIKEVNFFIEDAGQWRLLGGGSKKDGNIFQFDWDSFGTPNSSLELKVVVVDNAGNSFERTHTVVVANAFSEAVDVNAAFAEADESKAKAVAFRESLSAKAISSATVDALLLQADANLAGANSLAGGSQQDVTKAKLLIANAISLYNEAQSAVAVSNYKSGNFIFNKEQTAVLLGAAGYGGAVANEAKKLIDRLEPKRDLQVLKVVDDNATYYKAVVTVSFSIDANIIMDKNQDEVVLQVIEVVPKQFAEYASELGSDFQFAVLSDDPTLSFVLTKEQFKKKSFSYALKKDLSEQQADQLISGNVINKFVAPPVMLPPGTVTAGISLGLDGPVLWFALAAVVIVLAVLVFFALKKKKAGHGGVAPLAAAQPKKPLGQRLNIFKDLKKSRKQEEKPG